MDTSSHRVWLAQAALLTAAVIWGFAFVAQRSAMQHIGPFAFNGIRFLLGAAVLLPIGWKRLQGQRGAPAAKSTTRGAILSGLILFVASTLQQVGLVYTTAGKAGFLTGLYVVLVPLLGLFVGQRPRATVWTGAALAAGGTYLLSGTAAGPASIGDLLVLLGAFGWAIHVQLVGRLIRQTHPMRIAVIQNTVCGVLSLAVATGWERTSLSGLSAALPALLFAGVLSVGVAYTLQILGQRRIEPSHAGVLISLESVFAAVGGWVLLDEPITAPILAGCALMLVGMLLCQRKRSLVSRPS